MVRVTVKFDGEKKKMFLWSLEHVCVFAIAEARRGSGTAEAHSPSWPDNDVPEERRKNGHTKFRQNQTKHTPSEIPSPLPR
jgi:hypothetical protein